MAHPLTFKPHVERAITKVTAIAIGNRTPDFPVAKCCCKWTEDLGEASRLYRNIGMHWRRRRRTRTKVVKLRSQVTEMTRDLTWFVE